jgi:acyl-[acyl-carrier-protein] desaturase
MPASVALREKIYRAYMEFFDSAERKRRWNPFSDIPWEKLDPSRNDEDKAVCAETFCGVELYVPDYTANGFNLTREVFGHAWFQANWGYEESKHALVFREYLTRSGMRTLEQYLAFEKAILAKVWNLPFHTRRQMTCYGALQEAATYLIYKVQRERARESGDGLLEAIYFYISRDEAAHMGFYRDVLVLELEEDREGTLADLAHVLAHFRMPGVGLVPEYEKRMETGGVGITSQQFLEFGIFPTLRKLGTSRIELARARAAAQAGKRPFDARASALA